MKANNPSTPLLSLIIPLYNESQRLSTLPEISTFLRQLPFLTELVVVDDGSTDATLEQLHQLQKNNPIKIISYSPNRGKGFAIKQGMLAATGHWRGFMDVDLSVPLATIHEVLQAISTSQVIIGNRRKTGSKITKPQPKIRELLGSVFTSLTQVVLQVPVSDFTCGFKFFRQDAARAIFSQLTIERWSFDSEILLLTHLQKWKLHELPVTWHNDERTKVRFPQDVLHSLHDLILIWYRHFRQQYRSSQHTSET